jgi:Type II secretion system (T2SS), protein E, N-terminal domain
MMGSMKDVSETIRGNLIPQLCVLRRVPMGHRHVLPLQVMKKFQCIVVGSAPGVLTVAITDRQNTVVIEYLKKFTGQAIFPVLIDPIRMRLLIRRIERNEYSPNASHSSVIRNPKKTEYNQYSLLRLQVGSLITLLPSSSAR